MDKRSEEEELHLKKVAQEQGKDADEPSEDAEETSEESFPASDPPAW